MQFAVQVQTQTPLGAFPLSADALQILPEGAVRFTGHFRIVNDGAVRLDVVQASGLSQISPDQFPESDATRAAFHATGSQQFAYQFSSPDFALKIQADQILPEVSVSQLLAYNLGDSELAIDAEIELDIRDAPLREVVLNVPKGYILANISAPGMSDYFLSDGGPDLGNADCLWPAGFRPAGDRASPRTQPVAGRNELDAAAHRGGKGQIRARICRGVGGRGFPADDGAHAVVDRNADGIFPAQSRPAFKPRSV